MPSEPAWFPNRERPDEGKSGSATVVANHPSWIHGIQKVKRGKHMSTLDREASVHALLSAIFPEMKKSELVGEIMFGSFLKEDETFASLYSPIRTNNHQDRMVVDPDTTLNDLEWFASEESSMQRFRGKYVAIRERRVIGWGATAVEAYRMAKRTHPDAEPAITFIPERENTLL